MRRAFVGEVSGQAGTEFRASGQRQKPRRRRFAIQDKLRIVEASLVAGASVAGVALANGVNANLVFRWRKLHQKGLLGRQLPVVGLMPVKIAEQDTEAVMTAPAVGGMGSIHHEGALGPALRTTEPGTIHIQLPKARLRIEGHADASTLRVVLKTLRG